MDKNTIGIIAILAFLIIGSCAIMLLPEEEEPEDDADDETEEVEDPEASEDDESVGRYPVTLSVFPCSAHEFLSCR